MAGLIGGLENILGIDTNAGTAEMQQALAQLEAVGVPNAAQLTLPELQKYVSAGVLTPQQYQAIAADPTTYQNIASQADQTGTNAQKSALQQLGGIAQTGSTPIMKAQLADNLAQTNQAMQGARQGIEENAQERGVSGGGLEFISKLMDEQSNAQNANLGAIHAGANNAQLALSALANEGTLGTSLQGQENQMAQSKAQAAQQIAEYNSQLQSAANQYNANKADEAQAANLTNAQNISNQNVGNANNRLMYNAQVPQQVFSDQMQKAGAVSGALNGLAGLKENQAAQQNAFTGNLIGAGATMGGDYLLGQGKTPPVYGGSNGPDPKYNTNQYKPYSSGYAHGGEVQCYAQGGEVHDHRLCMDAGGTVPGDDSGMPMGQDNESQDVIPANLSPHEIVLPRSVSQAPNAPQAAAQFVGGIKGQGAPVDFAAIIKQLEDNGLELRLCSKDGGY